MSSPVDEFAKFVLQNSSVRRILEMSDGEKLDAALREIERQKERRREDRAEFERVVQQVKEQEGRPQQEPSSAEASEASDQLTQAIATLSSIMKEQTRGFTRIRESLGGAQPGNNSGMSSATVHTLISEFFGNEGPQRAKAWIQELLNTKTLYGWSEEITLSVAKARMRGDAKKWIMMKANTMETFEDFKTSFQNTFTYKLSRSAAMKLMMARNQKYQENIQVYVLDKLWLCSTLNLTTEDVRDEIASGLKSRELAQYMLGQTYANTDAILQDLVRVESIYEGRRGRTIEQRGSTTTLDEGKKYQHHEVNIKRSFTPKCYNCGKNGHIARDCLRKQKELICYVCKQVGHIAAKCINKRTRESENNLKEIKSVKVTNHDTSGNKFLRNIKIASSNLIALIDMGAAVCTIKASVVIRNGLQVHKNIQVLEGFGESSVESPGFVSEEVQVDNLKPCTLVFRIVPDNAQQTDVILGRPFTEAPNITYKRTGDNLVFEDLDPSIFTNLETARARTVETVTLRSNSVNVVNVSLDLTQLVMPIYNLDNEDKVIKPNTPIGKPIVEIKEIERKEPRKEPIHVDEIQIDKLVSEQEKEQLVELLNKYRICVAKTISEIGKTNLIEMDIEVKENAVVQAKPYRLNSKDRQELDQIIDEYRQAGIVTDTESTFASPAFLVRKKDNSPRMVIDYRKLNKVTKMIQYPIPNFDSLLESLNEARLFITLDLAWGYLQMPLTEAAKEKTAFITETQTGQFNRAMFGLCNAPRYFAKLMDRVLGVVRKKGFVFHFFDDIRKLGRVFAPSIVARENLTELYYLKSEPFRAV